MAAPASIGLRCDQRQVRERRDRTGDDGTTFEPAFQVFGEIPGPLITRAGFALEHRAQMVSKSRSAVGARCAISERVFRLPHDDGQGMLTEERRLAGKRPTGLLRGYCRRRPRPQVFRRPLRLFRSDVTRRTKNRQRLVRSVEVFKPLRQAKIAYEWLPWQSSKIFPGLRSRWRIPWLLRTEWLERPSISIARFAARIANARPAR